MNLSAWSHGLVYQTCSAADFYTVLTTTGLFLSGGTLFGLEAGTTFDRLRYDQPGKAPERLPRLKFNGGGRLNVTAFINPLTEAVLLCQPPSLIGYQWRRPV